MSRPAVSVVMPFAGDASAAARALAALTALTTAERDELILADNSGTAPSPPGVTVVRASGEHSPAHARNVGAEQAHAEWILFLDADCRAPAGLLDAYFASPVADDVGALAGEVVPAPEATTLAERYGAARSFLGQEAHLTHPYMPRAVAANLMVRRAAFEQIGGFYEGVRAAEDTDFSWRLQQAGWRLELRRGAKVEHRYRTTLSELRTQWRGYAAGRAWLHRRYEGFVPQPALERVLSRSSRANRPRASAMRAAQPEAGRLERSSYLALDGLLALEELAGLALSNRPPAQSSAADARVVLVADRFPVQGDPLVDFARTLDGVVVEAAARPDAPWVEVARELQIFYREDDGFAKRIGATARLLVRHPLRCALDLVRRHPSEPKLSGLAAAVLRLERQRGARIHPVGGEDVQRVARRLAALVGRDLGQSERR